MTEEIRRACRLADRRRLPQHRHRLLHARRPLEADRRRAAARELRARGGAHGADPELETDGVTISVGGEIGEVGKENSTVEELRAYLDGYRASSTRGRRAPSGISKVSVQTGTSHGGVPLPDGGVADGQARLRVLRASSARSPASTASPAPSSTALDAAGRAVPSLPGGRDRRDPPRDRLPERALRAPRLPGRAPSRDRGLVLRERGRRAQARPDRPAVRLHDPQEGDRSVQARSCGTSTRRTRSSPPSVARSASSSPSSV